MLGRDNLRDVVVFERVLLDNLESIGAGAFQGGAHAENLYCRATFPPVCEDVSENPPFGWAITKTSLLVVPEGSLSLYKEAYGWKKFSVISERPLADMPTSGIESVGSTGAVLHHCGPFLFSGQAQFATGKKRCPGAQYPVDMVRDKVGVRLMVKLKVKY